MPHSGPKKNEQKGSAKTAFWVKSKQIMSAQEPKFLPKPLCYICKKEVADFVIETHYGTLSVILTARCHGDQEQVIVPHHFFDKHFFTLRQGIAFAPKTKLAQTGKLTEQTNN